MTKENQNLIDYCTKVLNDNASDGYTVPSRELYPHQWLWDSCFTAIGLRHVDIKRAQQELVSLKRGAWSNGMLPNIIFHDKFLNYDYTLWESKLCPEAPRSFNTTCITQPPMLAEAIFKIGQKLNKAEQVEWYEKMFDCLLDYHLWLYKERDSDGDGLTVQLHPYESGLDNSPPWMYMLKRIKFPWWIRAFNGHSAEVALNHFRRDVEFVPASQRIGLKEAVQCFYIIRQLNIHRYKFTPKLTKMQPVMQDLVFNCIFIRANRCLRDIATAINKPLPSELLESMKKTENSLEKLWDEKHQQYFSRNYNNKKLIKRSTIATFMPLYAGSISKKRADLLANKLKDEQSFKPTFPVPSVPLNSRRFNPDRYWQGPTWVNTNWLIVEGLHYYGLHEQADELANTSVGLVSNGGAYEYFSPLDGLPKGAKNFSWTASLAIDLVKSRH